MNSIDRATLIDFALGRLDDAEAAALANRAERDSEFAQTLAALRRELAALDGVRPAALRSLPLRSPSFAVETPDASETPRSPDADAQERVLYLDSLNSNAVKVRRVGPVYPYYADETDEESENAQLAKNGQEATFDENAQLAKNGEETPFDENAQLAKNGEETPFDENAQLPQNSEETPFDENAQLPQNSEETPFDENAQLAKNSEETPFDENAPPAQNSEDAAFDENEQFAKNGEDAAFDENAQLAKNGEETPFDENAQLAKNGEETPFDENAQIAKNGKDATFDENAPLAQNSEDATFDENEQLAQNGEDAAFDENAPLAKNSEDATFDKDEQLAKNGEDAAFDENEQFAKNGEDAAFDENEQFAKNGEDEAANDVRLTTPFRRRRFIPKFIATPRASQRSSFVAKKARFLDAASPLVDDSPRSAEFCDDANAESTRETGLESAEFVSNFNVLNEIQGNATSGDPLGDAIQASENRLSEAIQASENPLGDAMQASENPLGDAIQASKNRLGEAMQASENPTVGAIQANENPIGGAIQANENPLGGAIQASENPLGEAIQANENPLDDAIQANETPTVDAQDVPDAVLESGDYRDADQENAADFNILKNERGDATEIAPSAPSRSIEVARSDAERRLVELLGREPTQDEKEEYYWEPLDEENDEIPPKKRRSPLGAPIRFATETTIAVGRTTLALCGIDRRAGLGSDAFAATKARRKRQPGKISDTMISTVSGFLIAVVVVWPLIRLVARDVLSTIAMSAVRKIGVGVPISENAPQSDVFPLISEHIVFPRYESGALQPLGDATPQETGARAETLAPPAPSNDDPASTPPTLEPISVDANDAYNAPFDDAEKPPRAPRR